jgi:hypothetical protein
MGEVMYTRFSIAAFIFILGIGMVIAGGMIGFKNLPLASDLHIYGILLIALGACLGGIVMNELEEKRASKDQKSPQ